MSMSSSTKSDDEAETTSTLSPSSLVTDEDEGSNQTGHRATDDSIDATDLIPKSVKLSPTEQRNPKSGNLSSMSISDCIELFIEEESSAIQQLKQHQESISSLIKVVSASLECNGRIFYVGAGTSGRLGVMDASECYSTFSTSVDTVQGIIAGGNRAVYEPLDCAEETFDGGVITMRERLVKSTDVVIAVTASGTTPFTWGGLWYGKRYAKCYTALITFNPFLEFSVELTPDQIIAIDVGPEILTGSTRLKCGTVTKVILNMISTLSLGVSSGRIRDNLMIHLHPSNSKLKERALRILMSLMNQTFDDKKKPQQYPSVKEGNEEPGKERKIPKRLHAETLEKILADHQYDVQQTLSHIMKLE